MTRRLSWRILLPNLVIVVVSLSLLAAAVLLFVRFYLVRETANELLKVRETAVKLIKAGVSDSPKDALTQAKAAQITRQTSLLFNVKVIILNADMNYPAKTTEQPLPEDLLSQVGNDGGVYSIRAGGEGYVATAIPYKAGTKDWNMLIYISLGPIAGFMRTLALIMLLALAGATLIAAFASAFVARRIAGPLRKLSRWAYSIGGRKFVRFTEQSNTQEIDFLAESLNGMASRLEEYDAAQKTFLQNASHELRTPLMSIQGYAEGIKHGVFADTGYAADIIIAESLRLTSLVDDLLYLSRLETADGFYTFTPLPIAEVLGQCVEKLEGAAIKEGKTLSLLPCPEATVNGDGEKLLRAVMNLAGNCLRYARSEVTLTLAIADSKAVIIVGDDGPGFSSEDLPHIFERFYKGKQGKFGLGLSIARAIVEKHGGKITAENGENGGAVFRVELPLLLEKSKGK